MIRYRLGHRGSTMDAILADVADFSISGYISLVKKMPSVARRLALRRRIRRNMNGEGTNFTPRQYQVELLEQCLKRNIIVCLGTGSGKTFIAVMLIQELSSDIRLPYCEGGKRTFFLTKTVPLVSQQAEVIELHTGLKVGKYIGAMDVDRWTKEMWQKELEKNEVFVMTTQILTNCLNLSFIKPSDINLLIVDECHHAVGNDPTVQIMTRLRDFDAADRPRILGLTASVLNGKCKPTQVYTKIKNLEKAMMATVETASNVSLAKLHATDPKEGIVACCQTSDYDKVSELLRNVIEQASNEIEKALENDDNSEEDFELEDDEQGEYAVILGPSVKLTSLLRDVSYILTTLGLWSGYQLAIQLFEEIKKMKTDLAEEYQKMVDSVNKALKAVIDVSDDIFQANSETDVEAMQRFSSHKVKRLLEVLHDCKKQVVGDQPLNAEQGSCSGKSYSPMVASKMVDIDDDNDDDDDDDNGNDFKICERPAKRAKKETPKLMAIVFVERRSTAWVLNKYLQTISEFNPEYNYIKADYVMGHGCDPTRLKYAQMKVRMQQEKIKKFRTGECNVLVATRVVEEGMDIPTCNIVIRFDEPKDFRSYLQSKGRARAKDAHYIILTNAEDEDKITADIYLYRGIEKALLKICHDRLPPTEKEIEDRLGVQHLPPFYVNGKEGPMVNMNSAIDLVNRYCDLLPHDKFTRLAPKVRYRKVTPTVYRPPSDFDLEDDEQLWDEYDPKPEQKIEEGMYVQCIIWMPINCPVRGPIEGEPMPTKKLAKKAVALEICKRLYKAGELNENLVPIAKDQSKFLKELVDIEEDVVENGKPKPGTAKRRQIYPKKVACDLMNSRPQPMEVCFLYRIQTLLCKKLDSEKYQPIYDPELSPQSFGIITSKKLPEVKVFPLNTRVGQLQVEIFFETELSLDEEQLYIVEHFHQFLFKEVLRIESTPFLFDPETSEFCVYIVPLIDVGTPTETLYFFDWTLMEATLLSSINLQLRTDEERRRFRFSEDQYTGAVVASLHHKPYHYYLVEHVLSNVDARHPFPDEKFHDFSQYYKEKYGIQIQHAEYPLLRVKILGGCPNMLPERVRRTGKVKTMILNGVRVEHMDLFLPELCEIHPLPGALWLKAHSIPSIIHRLNSLYLCQNLAMEIMLESPRDIADVYPHGHWSDVVKKYRDTAMVNEFSWGSASPLKRKLVVLHERNCCLGSTVILEAFTTRAANDCINLERLEVLGDSFLKYASSIFLLCEYPTADEGKLSLGRGKLVSNSYLYHLAKFKGISNHVLVQIFSPCTKWCPPGFTIDKKKEELLLASKLPYHTWQLLQNETLEGQTPDELLQLVRRKVAAQDKLKPNINDSEEQPDVIEFDENVFNEVSSQLISDKSVADCIEALIGANLMCIGPHAALGFMSWLGMNILPRVYESSEQGLKAFQIPNTGYLNPNQTASKKLLDSFNGFENKINYTFRDKSFMIEAFTHPTYSSNVLTNCYQRLEFLGDAILDYLVTWALFACEKKYCPGDLCSLRSALVNNVTFARLAVENGYNHYLKAWSPGLFTAIDKFLNLLKEEAKQEDDLILMNEDDTWEEAEVEVPKALGDMFESVAGAIYLDSGLSLDAVWQVYYPMMRPTIEKYVANIPREPVREVYETFPGIKFGKAKQVIEEGDAERVLHKVSVIVHNKKFTGIGKNAKHAKQNAAKCVLRYIRRLKCQNDAASCSWVDEAKQLVMT